MADDITVKASLPPDLAKLLADLLKLTEPDPVPLERWRDEVLAEYRPGLKAPTTRIRMTQALRELVELAGPGATTRDLTAELIARFATARPQRRAETTNGLLRAARTACNLAIARGYLRTSPFAGRRFWARPDAPTGPRHHGRAEIARVLAHLQDGIAGWAGHRLYALAAVYAYTGLRRDEALRLRVEDVDLGRGFVFVRPNGRSLKTAASHAPVPCPAALVAILAAWIPRSGQGGWVFPGVRGLGPWTGGKAGQRPADRLKAAGRAVGVEGFTPHSLRRSLATHLAGHHGLSPRQIRMVLRHSNDRTQDRHYIQPDLANLAGMVRGFTFDAPDPGPDAAGRGPGSRVDPGHPAPARRMTIRLRRRPAPGTPS
jgi:integrase